jgi:hypothetical protein
MSFSLASYGHNSVSPHYCMINRGC